MDMDNLLESEYSRRFDYLRKNRMLISFHKYGPVKENYGIENLSLYEIKSFICKFETEMLSLKKSISYLENNYLPELVSSEKSKKIKLIKGSIKSMKDKQELWLNDLKELNAIYNNNVKKINCNKKPIRTQISMF